MPKARRLGLNKPVEPCQARERREAGCVCVWNSTSLRRAKTCQAHNKESYILILVQSTRYRVKLCPLLRFRGMSRFKCIAVVAELLLLLPMWTCVSL